MALNAEVRRLFRQQAAIAQFGSFALREWDLDKILTEAVRACAEGLSVSFSKVCRYRAEHEDLLIVAGYGWNEGVVGQVVSRANMSSPQGRAFSTGLPCICDDIRADAYFDLPSFYAAHGVIATIDVIIKGRDDKPYGILEIDSDQARKFDQHDIIFLNGFANVLAEAVATAARAAELQVTIGQMQALVVEKQQLLQQKDEADLQLRHAQKMEALGQLTGGIAHDLNNILTVIVGNSELLVEGCADRPQLAALAKGVDRAAARGADLTQRLLAFARKQPLQAREVDVNSLVIEVCSLLRQTLSDQIEIQMALDKELAGALIDPSQLTNALINLALNARDAMAQGGKLSIGTSNVVLEDCGASAGDGGLSEPCVLISVTDTGDGIPAAILDQVFEPFFTTKGVGKGSGLGLSMVYGFVQQSGGDVRISSEEGIGTTVRMYLPQATGVARSSAAAPGPLSIQGTRETVLVVEDDEMVRNSVTAQVESLGYLVLAAANAEEALVVINSARHIDLLFTDMIMPGALNGRQLADQAVRRRASLQVLFTSGYSDDNIVHFGRLDSDVLLLPKPYRKADLARMIRLALDADRPPRILLEPIETARDTDALRSPTGS